MKTSLHVYLLTLLLQCLIGCEAGSSSNVLGLSRSDINLGGPIDVEVLSRKTIEAAERFLPTISDKLRQISRGRYSLTPDLSKVGQIRGMGYRSSFYYFCWDIYLPFEFETENGESLVLIAQLSDRIPGNKHDIDQFNVIRVFVVDQSGKLLEQIENTG